MIVCAWLIKFGGSKFRRDGCNWPLDQMHRSDADLKTLHHWIYVFIWLLSSSLAVEDLQVIKNIKIAKQLAKDCCAFANARNGIWFTSNNLHTNGQRTLSFVTKYCNMPRGNPRDNCCATCAGYVAQLHFTIWHLRSLKVWRSPTWLHMLSCQSQCSIIAAKGTLNCTPW